MTTPVLNTNWSNEWAANLAALSKSFNTRVGTGSQPSGNLMQSFATELSQILQSSTNGSQFEIDIVPQSSSSASAPFKILVRNVTPGVVLPDAASTSMPTDAVPASDASESADGAVPGETLLARPHASSGSSEGAAAGGSAGGTSCAPRGLLSNGYPVGSEGFLAEFGPPASDVPGPTVLVPAKPVFYEPPPTQSVNGVKTVESVMQEVLVLTQHGTSQMINGNWSLQYLKDSFRDQAEHTVAGQGNNLDPRIVPENWQEIADRYANMYLDWLTKTDASYWDPKLSGPVLDPATGQVQTSNGPVPAGVPLGSLSTTRTRVS